MTLFLKTNLAGFLVLFMALPLFSTNIAIIESQSYDPTQNMDENWKTIITELGHTADILPQSTLDDLANLNDYELLITSSGLITLTAVQKATIEAFVISGRPAYLQSEFSITHSGNETFATIVNNHGGSFQWLGAQNGSIALMDVLPPLNDGVATVDQLAYYWYGTYGSGDETVTSILRNSDKDWGFIFQSPDPSIGVVITITDQDWIRIQHSNDLMKNIIDYLINRPLPPAMPTVEIAQANDPTCAGETYEFITNITDSVDDINFQWQINGLPVPDADQPIFTTTDLIEGDVVECLIGVQSNSSYQHLSNPILIAPILPLAEVNVSISANSLLVCENEAVIITATGDNWGNQPTFSWTVNGVTITGATTAVLTTTVTSSQLVACTVNSTEDCISNTSASSNSVFINIINTVAPDITIVADQTAICSGSLVTFNASGNNWGNNTSFDWQIDGNSINNNANIFTTNTLSEGQVVTCVLTNLDDCQNQHIINSNPITISIGAPVTPTIEVQANLITACPGETITYSATGTYWGADPSFIWTINGQEIATTNQPSFTYGQSTTDQIMTCEVISSDGCTIQPNANSNEITVASFSTASPFIDIIADNVLICNGSTVNFRAEGENWGTSPNFEWKVDGVTMNNSAAFFAASGLQDGQQVTCQLTTDLPCIGVSSITSNSVTIQSSDFRLEILERANASCGMNNGLVEFAIEGGAAPYRIQWNNGLTETFANDLAPGTYEIFALDAGGCTAELTIEIEGLAGPQIETLTVIDAICEGSTGAALVTMSDTLADFTFQWINEQNFILSKADTLSAARPGSYTLLVSDHTGCSTSQTLEINQTVDIQATIYTEEMVTLGTEIELNLEVEANSTVRIAWKDSSLLSCTDCFRPELIPTETAIYTAVITSAEGCVKEISQKVSVQPVDDIYVPNAFSPNSDGINDFFAVYGGTEYVNQINSMQIFNRWGSKVFSRNDLEVNDEPSGWNGKVGGDRLDAGIYIYVIEVSFIDGTKKQLTGDVTLVR